jgi:hypothetical protein
MLDMIAADGVELVAGLYMGTSEKRDPFPELAELRKKLLANKEMTIDFIVPAEPLEIVVSTKQ